MNFFKILGMYPRSGVEWCILSAGLSGDAWPQREFSVVDSRCCRVDLCGLMFASGICRNIDPVYLDSLLQALLLYFGKFLASMQGESMLGAPWRPPRRPA